ncbi:MAG: hypothetical protein ABSH15_00795 [Verrucomicrobiota bacterium]
MELVKLITFVLYSTIKPPSTAKNVVIASTTNQDNEEDETIVEIIYFSASYSMYSAPADS